MNSCVLSRFAESLGQRRAPDSTEQLDPEPSVTTLRGEALDERPGNSGIDEGDQADPER
jgi:hypothetical protein